MEEATERYMSKRIWLNAVGVAGAILSDMGFSPELAKGVVLVARSISLVAHVSEETAREKGWRASTHEEITQPLDLELQRPEFYDGPPDRKLPETRRKL